MRKIAALIVIVALLSLVYAPQIAVAAPPHAWPGTGVYASCDGDRWELYVDLRQIQWLYDINSGWGTYVPGSGIQEVAYGWDGFYSKMEVGWNGVSVINPTLMYDTQWITFSRSGDFYRYTPWAQGVSSWIETFSGHMDTSPSPAAQFAGGISIAGYNGSQLDYLTSVYASGTFTGDCPFSDYPPVGDLDRVWPLRADVTYEVNHIDGYGPIVDDVHTEQGATAYNSLAGQVVAITDSGSGYLVKVVADDDNYVLYDNLTAVYPKLNDQIDAGCVIGTVGESFKAPSQTYTQDPGLLWFYAGTDFYTAADNDYIDWQNAWIEPPAVGVPCGSELRTDHCLNYNPNLDDDARGWTLYHVDPYDVNLSSIKLAEYSSAIAQYMVLDHEVDYYLTVQSRIYHNYDYYTVTVNKATTGDLIDTLTETINLDDLGLNLGDPVITEVGPLDLSDYDVNDTYLISIAASNTHTEGINLDDVCVNDGSIQVSVSPCYLDNHEFNIDAGADWDSSATGATFRDSPMDFDSDVVLDPGGWIAQPISLASYDGQDADYKIEIKARAVGDISSLTDIFTTGFYGDLDLTVETGVMTITTLRVGNVGVTLPHNHGLTITSGNTLVGNFTITNDALSPESVAVSSVCISPVAGYWPGDEPDINEETSDTCSVCAMPTAMGVDVLFQWIAWLWCNLRNLFYCTLAKWLQQVSSYIVQGRDLLAFVGKYMSVLIAMILRWFFSVVNAVGTASADGGSSLIAAAWNAIAGLGIIQALFDAIGYASAFLTGALATAVAAIQLLTSLLNALLSLGRLGIVMLSALAVAFNGSAATLDIPSCTVITSGLQDGYCAVFILGSGIFDEFPVFTVGFAIASGVIGFITLIWTMRQIGGAFGNV